jgi:hypothetical protein
MKTMGLCVGVGFLAFLLAGYQAGLFRDAAPSAGEGGSSDEKKEAKKGATLRFPQDLAPAARAEAVPQAAAYDSSAGVHRMVILKTTGALYKDWQDRLREEWQAERVEETSLAMVVSPHKKTFLEIIHYPGGAPPISRYKWEVEVSIVEVKTGKVLANRLFVNMPRDIVRVETWDTTALGSPVEFRTVFNWAASGARGGFPPVENPTPIINVVN